jgi:hypothetical protein
MADIRNRQVTAFNIQMNRLARKAGFNPITFEHPFELTEDEKKRSAGAFGFNRWDWHNAVYINTFKAVRLRINGHQVSVVITSRLDAFGLLRLADMATLYFADCRKTARAMKFNFSEDRARLDLQRETKWVEHFKAVRDLLQSQGYLRTSDDLEPRDQPVMAMLKYMSRQIADMQKELFLLRGRSVVKIDKGANETEVCDS